MNFAILQNLEEGTRYIKAIGTLKIHKDLQRATYKITLKMRLQIFSGRPYLFVRKDQNILISK